jgi:hypothetical protein
VYILSAQRDDPEIDDTFAPYEEYLRENRERFPPGAYELAMSECYFGFSDHRAPHDAWLEEVEISEPAEGERREIRTVSIRIRLLGAYHDGYIELVYPRVYSYQIAMHRVDGGAHRDWRYDEFRVTDDGHLLHEIEWWSYRETAKWLIEADDVQHRWIPFTAEYFINPSEASE